MHSSNSDESYSSTIHCGLGPWKWVYDPKYKNPANPKDPFHLVGPNKYQYGDHTLWENKDTNKFYLYWRARTQNAGFRGYQLNDDCTDVAPETDTHIFNSPNREAPAFFSHEGNFYLWASGTLGWYVAYELVLLARCVS